MSAKYTPLRFLSALGNGGMVVTFFLYLNFLLPHSNTPIIDFNNWMLYMKKGNMLGNATIVFCLLGTLYFAFRHVLLVINNFKVYKEQKFDEQAKKTHSRERMVIQLTLAMTVNVFFILGSLFVPNLWTVTEYLFPFAIAAFLVIGIFALRVFIDCFTHVVVHGEGNKSFSNLSRLIPVFTFSMVSVGLAAAAAMSHLSITATVGAVLSIFFLSLSLMLIFIQFPLGFSEIIKKGIDEEASASIWIMIPIITITGITFVRLFHYFEHHFFHGHMNPAIYFIMITVFFAIQIALGFIGYFVMKANGYFKDYIHGDKKSFGSYALICPGVAFFVFGMFFVKVALIKSKMMTFGAPLHYIMIAFLAIVQIQTIFTIIRLDRKLLK
jgi:hypothetical protein